ncbi:GNAT family N-acetyltransferase [Paraburkholderia oxyphila]|uniref:GNAT family N-acetyltransferase n=1 Tax=Paraburkholderia oxyphila TaxID=614212 RepID=UPI0005BC633D|nr:GNAT family N-acetyltransferase [Paraburkholderia oxyphila]
MSTLPASSNLVCLPFSDADIEGAHALSLEVRWPHRADDWRLAARTGAGFVVKDGERLVGTALYWPWSDQGATLGLVIVAPDQQGRGIGRMLMERLLDAIGPRMTVLHATPAGQPLYEKLGFRKIGLLHQHQDSDFRAPRVEPPPGERLRPLEPRDTPRLIALASRASGLERGTLLLPLLDIAQGVALVTGGDGEHAEALLGFALLRPFGRGHAIGPVAVSSAGGLQTQRAQALIADRLAANAGAFTRIDTPDEQGLGPWLESLGLARVDTVVKMARNGEPARDPDVLQFAIVNQALG